jgi:hypothetical protein
MPKNCGFLRLRGIDAKSSLTWDANIDTGGLFLFIPDLVRWMPGRWQRGW